MDLYVNQEANVQTSGWWQWAVWLEGPSNELDQVASVDYVLHPTFREPVQQRANRAENFRLDASGWGEFMIHIHIHLRDGQVVKQEHWLSLIDELGQHALEKEAAMIQAPAKDEAVAFETVPAGFDSEPLRTRLFLSCSLADQHLADEVGKQLDEEAIDFVLADDYGINLPLQKAMQLSDDPIAGAVFFVSDVRSPHLRDELGALPGHVPVVPVLIGDATKAPAALADMEPVRVGSMPLEETAREIARALRDHFRGSAR